MVLPREISKRDFLTASRISNHHASAPDVVHVTAYLKTNDGKWMSSPLKIPSLSDENPIWTDILLTNLVFMIPHASHEAHTETETFVLTHSLHHTFLTRRYFWTYYTILSPRSSRSVHPYLYIHSRSQHWRRWIWFDICTFTDHAWSTECTECKLIRIQDGHYDTSLIVLNWYNLTTDKG